MERERKGNDKGELAAHHNAKCSTLKRVDTHNPTRTTDEILVWCLLSTMLLPEKLKLRSLKSQWGRSTLLPPLPPWSLFHCREGHSLPLPAPLAQFAVAIQCPALGPEGIPASAPLDALLAGSSSPRVHSGGEYAATCA